MLYCYLNHNTLKLLQVLYIFSVLHIAISANSFLLKYFAEKFGIVKNILYICVQNKKQYCFTN